MPELRELIRRFLGVSEADRPPSLPKRARYDSTDASSQDDPPMNKRYRAVRSHFPKVMPVDSEENWKSLTRIQNKPRVHDIPVRRENLPSASFFTKDNIIPKDSSSPILGRNFKNDRVNYSNWKINDNYDDNINCTCKTHCAVHSPPYMKGSQLRRSLIGNSTRARNMIDNILADSNNLHNNEVINVDNDEDDDDYEGVEIVEPKSCCSHVKSNNKSDDVELSDTEYDVVLVKPAVKIGRIFDTSRRKMSPQQSYHLPLHRQSRINKYSESPFTAFNKRIFSKYLPNNGRVSKRSDDKFSRSVRLNRNNLKLTSAVTAPFKLREKKYFEELIERTRSILPNYYYSKKPNDSFVMSNILSKTPILGRPRTNVIDLTETLYDKNYVYENGNDDQNQSENAKNIDISEIYDIESSDDEVKTVTQSTSVLKVIPENSLKLSMQSKMITQSSWIQNITERYEKISICKENEIEKIEIGEEEEQLIELNEKQEQRISAALKPSPSNEILIEKFNMSIHRRDIQTLSGLNWLNDEVINFYMNLIMERSQKKENLPKVYGMNTFFFPKLMQSGHIGLKRWTRKVDIFSYNIILVPVHLGVHWCMSIINFKSQDIRYYDSMGGKNMECCAALLKYLEDELMDKKKENFNRSSWKLECVKDIPQQMNGSDCGMFSCMFAEYISRNAPITFTQNDMPYFRRKMIFEIIEGQLLL